MKLSLWDFWLYAFLNPDNFASRIYHGVGYACRQSGISPVSTTNLLAVWWWTVNYWMQTRSSPMPTCHTFIRNLGRQKELRISNIPVQSLVFSGEWIRRTRLLPRIHSSWQTITVKISIASSATWTYQPIPHVSSLEISAPIFNTRVIVILAFTFWRNTCTGV